jgi:hypothetical protein
VLQNGGMNYFSLLSIIKMMGRKEVRKIWGVNNPGHNESEGVTGVVLLCDKRVFERIKLVGGDK